MENKLHENLLHAHSTIEISLQFFSNLNGITPGCKFNYLCANKCAFFWQKFREGFKWASDVRLNNLERYISSGLSCQSFLRAYEHLPYYVLFLGQNLHLLHFPDEHTAYFRTLPKHWVITAIFVFILEKRTLNEAIFQFLHVWLNTHIYHVSPYLNAFFRLNYLGKVEL